MLLFCETKICIYYYLRNKTLHILLFCETIICTYYYFAKQKFAYTTILRNKNLYKLPLCETKMCIVSFTLLYVRARFQVEVTREAFIRFSLFLNPHLTIPYEMITAQEFPCFKLRPWSFMSYIQPCFGRWESLGVSSGVSFLGWHIHRLWSFK